MKYLNIASLSIISACAVCNAHAGFLDKVNAVLDTVDKVNNTIDRGENSAQRTKNRIPTGQSTQQQPQQQQTSAQQFPNNIEPLYISGNWSSDWGDISFNQIKDENTQIVDKAVFGTYNFQNGRIYGTMNGNVLEGYWIQSSSTRDCGVIKQGSRYWGTVKFTFSGNQFKGFLGYCDSPPDINSQWNGYR